MLVAAKVDRKALSHSAYCLEGWWMAAHLQPLQTATEGDYHNTSITPTSHLPLLQQDKDSLASSQTETDGVSRSARMCAAAIQSTFCILIQLTTVSKQCSISGIRHYEIHL
jgi:hypothetical protein